MSVTLGKTDNGTSLRLDVERLVSTRMLLQANSGGGKSWALRRLLEQTHGLVQHLVIDPEGEFYTLREAFDYVLAGKGGDCPAEPRSAEILARRLWELGCSTVVDVHELKRHEQIRFVRVFLETLVRVAKSRPRPCLVVVDEAHIFAPQTGQSECLSAVVDLMARGRKRGLCGILATQRISKLHKDAAAEANNVFIGRARQDVDRKRAADELGLRSKADALELRGLKAGEFYSFGPALEPGEVERMTFGRVKTPHPKVGASVKPPAPPRAKVRAILGELADLPAEAEEEARTVADLQAKVRELTAEIRKAQRAAPAPSEADLEVARAEGRDEGLAALAGLRSEVRAAAGTLGDVVEKLERVAESDDPAPTPRIHRTAPKMAPESRPPRRARRTGTPPAQVGDVQVDGPMQRILDALAWLESAGIPAPYSRVQVAFLAGYNHRGGGFNNPLGRLRSAGLITYPQSGFLDLTDEGAAAADAPSAPLSAVEMQDRVREIVDGPMWRILEPLIHAYPESMDRADLAAAAGYEAGGGGFSNPLSRLRSLGLIDYPSKGSAVALPVLFPGSS